jgi:hypothetical protein
VRTPIDHVTAHCPPVTTVPYSLHPSHENLISHPIIVRGIKVGGWRVTMPSWPFSPPTPDSLDGAWTSVALCDR